MSYIFVSHSSENNAEALALARWLEDNGWSDCFLDISEHSGLSAGSRWQAALKQAAHRCEAVILIISRAWNDSIWCKSEFLLTHQLGKQIFGVLVDDIPISELPIELTAEYQLCDLLNGDSHVTFNVDREPFVPKTRVEFPEVGLTALKHGLQKAGLDATSFAWPPENEPDRAPYRGLKPYEAKDAAVYFGRDAAIVRGLDQIRQLRTGGIDKLLVILGSSGAGKSSFMRAGLWPRLQRDDRHYYPLPIVRPGGAAMSGEEGLIHCLATALTDVGVTDVSRGEIRHRFQADRNGEALSGYVAQLREALMAKPIGDLPEPTIVLPIDQGEELYASDGAEESTQFRTQLAYLGQPDGEVSLQRRQSKLLVMVTIRTDLYGLLQDDPLLRDMGRQMLDLHPMDRTEYKRIIEGPAQRATEASNALVVEPELSERLLADTHGADALPMLAFTLERLYTDYSANGDLTLEDYGLSGGVTGSLEAAIEAAMGSPQNAPVIPADKITQARLLKQAFIPWLAEVDEQSGERRRRVAGWDELPAETQPILERLVHARLLVRDLRSDGLGEEKREVVEIAHEALLRRWPALVGWLDADQDALKTIGAVSRAALRWAKKNENDEYLDHAGERLSYAEGLLARGDFAHRLGATGREYLARCRAVDMAHQEKAREQQEKEKTQQRRLRFAFAVAALLAIGASGAALWGNYKANEATTAQMKAEEEKTRADTKTAEAIKEKEYGQRTLSLMHAGFSRQQTDEGHATRGILLALAALPRNMDSPERPYVPQAEAALYTGLNALREQRILNGHEDEVHSAAFSPDGTRVVTASWDKTARLWDVASGQSVTVLNGHESDVNSAAFSPDGTRVVTASDDNTARLWDAASGRSLAVLIGHDAEVNSAVFSPDGTRVVTASSDNTARLWDVASGQSLTVLNGHEGAVYGAAFSPDGTRVVTSSRDNTALVWDAASGQSLAVLIGHDADVNSAAFGPDGTRVVTASLDNTSRLWDAASGQSLAVFNGHDDRVNSAVFSPDGSRVVTASSDNNARLWDVASGQSLAVLKGHEGPVTSAEFSPDGIRVVTASSDRTARLWGAASSQSLAVLNGHDAEVNSAVFSPDGTLMVTASSDNTARLWDAASGQSLAVLHGHDAGVNSAAFSPDGNRVVTASYDNTARLWDAASGQLLAVLYGHDAEVFSAVFSPDGTRVVTASRDKTARLWDTASGQSLAVLNGHDDRVNSAIFSPDGTRVVTASYDDTARLWDAASGQSLAVLNGHDGWVKSAAFSPDGTRVVTVSIFKTARLWDAASGQSLAVLNGHDAEVNGAAFSPDGTRVVTASYDNTARLWDAASGQSLAVLNGHDDWVFSATFSPDGTRVVTASSDNTARLWDATSGQFIAVLIGHESAVVSAVFSPDGTRVMTASDDNTARLWDVELSTFSLRALTDRARERLPRKALNKAERKQFFVPAQ